MAQIGEGYNSPFSGGTAVKQIILGIAAVTCLVVILAGFIIGLSVYDDYSAREFVRQYYEDMIQGNYDDAFAHVHLWTDAPDKPVRISAGSAQKAFLKKVSFLKARGYKIDRVDDIAIVQEGSNYGAKVKLTIDINGRQKQVDEHLNLYDARLVVTDSEDPFAHYRDGLLTN